MTPQQDAPSTFATIERVIVDYLEADGWSCRQRDGSAWIATHGEAGDSYCVEITVSELALAVAQDVERRTPNVPPNVGSAPALLDPPMADTRFAVLADTIDRQFADPSTPPRWNDFSDDDWKLVALALRLTDETCRRLKLDASHWRVSSKD